jgi:hypothetical protein
MLKCGANIVNNVELFCRLFGPTMAERSQIRVTWIASISGTRVLLEESWEPDGPVAVSCNRHVWEKTNEIRRQ